ncbi:hypothetical protein D0Z03_002543 [Geotrichum reessii]|nr:hypothetical protein D0Z03_002543 [Galactomyces reessii]
MISIASARPAIKRHWAPLPLLRRGYADTSATLSVESARAHCLNLLKEQDRSSYVLHSYVAPPARDAFLAIRAFNIDTAKIGDTVSKAEIAQFRFEFWRATIQKVFSAKKSTREVPQEPVAVLMAHSLLQKDYPITMSKRFFITLLQTREKHVTNPPFRTIDSLASYGEGTHSQLNYLLQEILYSVSPKTTTYLNEYPEIAEQCHDIVAHIGQATGIAAMLRGFTFYASRGFVPLPVQLLNKKDLSQDGVLRFLAGETDGVDPQTAVKLSDIVFETATRANDHLITAATMLGQVKESLDNTLPDAIMVPALASIPTKLFLERLEKYDFDIVNSKLMKKGATGGDNWKLPYRSFKAYKLRKI